MAQSDEEEDYMTMVFEDAPKGPKYETSLQRAARKRREGEERSRQKTKAEKEAEAEEAREAALATALPTTNKGFKMMAKFGFKQGDTLGRSENARKEPVQINIKEGRGGIGIESEKKRKFKEQWEKAEREAKRSKEEDFDYREAQRQQLREKKLERDLYNTQKVAERLHDEAAGIKDSSKIPLKNINVLWRSLARHRLEKLSEKKQEQYLKNSLLSRATSRIDGEDEDDDNKLAMGRHGEDEFVPDDLEEEDPEQDEFDALPMDERLLKLLTYLREEHHYCYWCGHKYHDAAMEGCPGVTEEEHD